MPTPHEIEEAWREMLQAVQHFKAEPTEASRARLISAGRQCAELLKRERVALGRL